MFFDDFKRNASDAADKAVKKTAELKNLAVLKMNIKTNEAKLDSVFEDIGRLFYSAERNNEDNTSEIAANILKADKLNAEIAVYKTELSKLKKIKACPECGTEIDINAFYCCNCGAKQPVIVTEEPASEEADAEEVIVDDADEIEVEITVEPEDIKTDEE